MCGESRPAVVLLSGGVDSSVLLHHVARDLGYVRIHAVSFRYGQRHARELKCAAWQAAAAGTAAHTVLDLSFLSDVLKHGSSLVEGGAEVPDLADLAAHELDQPSTYVPNRNMMLLSVAAAYAEAHRIRDIFYGAQAHDEYGYWDCTADFLEGINRVLALNRRDSVTVHAPFVAKSKSETVALGLKLGVDFSHTWSCYRGDDEACGTCPTCVERLAAFREAGAHDPVAYRRG
ncbi:MAG: 7-cyano-7-deazaguanine synthase QueC [bacterium]|nr:7-cyano-7-deazaguanine synthase QueC [bacterium]